MKIARLFLSTSVALLSVLAAQGANKIFNNSAGNGLWSDAANWTASGVPGSADTASIGSGLSATISSGFAASTSTLAVGYNSSGSLTIDGGSFTLGSGTGEIRVGWTSAASGAGYSTLSVINGGSLTGNLLAISRGPSTYTQYDSLQGWVKVDATSVVSVSILELARRGRTGTLELLASTLSTGASVSANTLTMGTASGTANLLIGQNGTLTVLTTANLAGTSGTSSITVNGGTFVMSSIARVHGHATFNLTNATVAAANLQVFSGATLSGDVRVSGTTVSGNKINAVNFILNGGGVLDGDLLIDGSSASTFAVSLSGAVGSVAAATVNGVITGVSGGTITIDFTSVTGLAIGSEVTVLLAEYTSGFTLASILTTGLDSSLQAIYSIETSGAQSALVATIAAIPEPAVAAAVMALLGLVAVMRRRK